MVNLLLVGFDDPFQPQQSSDSLAVTCLFLHSCKFCPVHDWTVLRDQEITP